MQIQLSDHFTFGRLFRFVLPTVVMMIFSSIYGVVDGLFVSNFVGKTPFAAINLIMPVLQILGALSLMLGIGGSALVSKYLGEQRKEKANKTFSLLVYTGIAAAVVFALAAIIFIKPIAVLLGAEGELIRLCAVYATIQLVAMPFMILQSMFQIFLITAERPDLGLKVTVVAGVTNVALDALFIAVFKWGIVGASVATAISQMVCGLVPLVFFSRPNNSALRLVKTEFDGAALLKTFTNGSSEFVVNISAAVVAVLYNYQLMSYAGEDGIAAYGVIMYVSFIFMTIFFGYANGIAPVIGYNYGAKNAKELKNIFQKSMLVITVSGIMLTTLAVALSAPLSGLFVSYDSQLYEMTAHAFRVYAFSFLFSGFGIFGSAMFTALNNGGVSATISFVRTMIFQGAAILVMPMLWGIEGVWYAIIIAEALAAVMAMGFVAKYRKRYQY